MGQLELIINVVEQIVGKSGGISENSDLIEEIGLDSVQLMMLMGRIEESFELSFTDQDFEIEHFRTPASILNLVERIS